MLLERLLRDDRLLRALRLDRKAFDELKLIFERELLKEEVLRRSQEHGYQASSS